MRRIVLTALLALALEAQAGRACDATAPAVDDVGRSLALAQLVRERLDASGATVVVLARAGQDLSRYGLAWSHVGLAYREPAGGAWRVAHKLNHCGTDSSALYRQGLGDFFLDRPHRYEAAYVVLSPGLQERLLPRLRDNAQVARLHQPHYSMVAYAWGLKYQQSNQWALETLAADGAAGSREAAQHWLQTRGYRPLALRVDPLARLGARLGMPHVAFDDHPLNDRLSGRIATVTADSLLQWLRDARLAGEVEVVR